MPIWAYILCGVAWWVVGFIAGCILRKSGPPTRTVGDLIVLFAAGIAGVGMVALFVAIILDEKSSGAQIVIWPPSKWKGKG